MEHVNKLLVAGNAKHNLLCKDKIMKKLMNKLVVAGIVKHSSDCAKVIIRCPI
jgi:hypothetical protein